MKRVLFSILLFVGFSLRPALSQAQTPTVAGVFNSASYARPGLPNAGIAQGSIFAIFGDNLGPAALVLVSGLPFPSTAGLAGTSVSVTVGATTVTCLMVGTLKTQIAAVLPSNTPAGTGTVRVTYNGQTSAPAAITVVARALGIFALNQAGSGPGVLQNVNTQTDQPINSATRSAHPQQLMILWATGIGPLTVQGSEANGAGIGVDMPNVNLHVFVGVQEAQVVYRGRSGCCIGIDQIAFTVPAGVQGCTVPVYVVVDGIVSNFVSIAITASGNTCSDPNGYSSSDIDLATANGGLRVASLAVQRFFLRTINIVQNILPSRYDLVSASYSRVPLSTILAGQGAPAVGSCTVAPIPSPPLAANTPLNAGTLSVSGPVGNRTLAMQSAGSYYLYFSPGSQPLPGYVTDGTLVTPGTYNIAATAGTDVGAHNASINDPATFTWTQFDGITTNVPRSQGLLVSWTGGTAGATVLIGGQSQSSPGVGASFYCFADSGAGSFTVPAAILSAMPVPYSLAGVPQGSLYVIQVLFGGHPSIPGIDVSTIGAYDGYNVGPINFQ
jgi:uncharacterized protein (TIGR03437 family)